MDRLTVGVVIALAGAGCSAPDSGTNARQDALLSALAADVSRNSQIQESRIAELEERITALENRPVLPQAAAGAPGAWIVWKVEEIHDNPNNILGAWIPPKPMYAYSTQAECAADAARVALQNGGSADRPTQYFQAGTYGTTLLVTLRCLPKEVDPRKLD